MVAAAHDAVLKRHRADGVAVQAFLDALLELVVRLLVGVLVAVLVCVLVVVLAIGAPAVVSSMGQELGRSRALASLTLSFWGTSDRDHSCVAGHELQSAFDSSERTPPDKEIARRQHEIIRRLRRSHIRFRTSCCS